LAVLGEQEQRGSPEWQRVQELLAEHHSAWLGPLDRPGWQAELHRGLIRLAVSGPALLAEAERLAWGEQVQIDQVESVWQELLVSPVLRRFEHMHLSAKQLEPLLQAAEQSPPLDLLLTLDLRRRLQPGWPCSRRCQRGVRSAGSRDVRRTDGLECCSSATRTDSRKARSHADTQTRAH
jgi:hypothetical protein